jgi:hypothetical protein
MLPVPRIMRFPHNPGYRVLASAAATSEGPAVIDRESVQLSELD